MEKTLTISIAAYNVEKYIRTTLESLCKADVFSDIEVLVIDDGSQDNTYSIAQEYEDRYPQTFKAIHKQNGGWGSTVNYAIDIAKGKYFRILDGDDYFDPEGLSRLVGKLKEIVADVIYTPYKRFEDKTGKSIQLFTAGKVAPKGVLLPFAETETIYFAVHSVTVRTALLAENQVYIKENCFYTDSEFVTKALAYAKTAYITDICVYQYRIGRQNQSVDISGLAKHYKDSIDVAEQLVQFAKNIEKTRNANYVLNGTKRSILYCYRALLLLNKRDEWLAFDMTQKNNGRAFYDIDNKMVRHLRATNCADFTLCMFLYRAKVYCGKKVKIILNDLFSRR